MVTRILFFVALFFSSSTLFAQNQLWYDHPATNWNEALPIGNGSLAAMVFGSPGKEQLQLNEETVWAGEPGNNLPNTNFLETLSEIRRLIFEGNHEAAQALAMKVLPRDAGPSNNYGMPYQPVGNLLINFPGHENHTQYKRTLNIDEAITTTTYRVDNVTFKREIFASFTDNVIIIRLTSSERNKISCSLGLNSPHENQSISNINRIITLKGTAGSHSNKKGSVEFHAMIKPVLEGGSVKAETNELVIKDANAVTIFLSIGTNFKSYDNLGGKGATVASERLAKASDKKYQTLRSSHVTYYKNLFDRVSLSLGADTYDTTPTDLRLEKFSETQDPSFVALYFNFGRYLLISASQPGSQPANLQGKWNNLIAPPWDSKYTININTEMNYWPAEVTNLSELHTPLFSMLRDLEQTGKVVAEKMYGARGWVVHHNTDLWRIAAPVDGAYYGLWPLGGAWLSQHIWQHYLFTGDENFLKKHYSILKGAALFYHDVLIEEPKQHWLVVSPSMSPENEHHRGISIAAGTTMDNQIVFDVFSNFIRAATILKQDERLRDSISNQRTKLPPMQVGKFGQLQEWLEDWDRADDKHRHVSHLYGLYPSNQISLFRNPELFQAARTSLTHRGDHSTGWSMGWKVNLWARLLDGEKAYQLIKEQLTPVHQGEGHGGTYLNLFDAHPPFQIDGNFGCTSGIAEMFVQSHDGVIHLLPALPQQWSSGKITGLKTRGGFTIDLAWTNGRLQSAKVVSTLGGNCRIRSGIPLDDNRLKKSSGTNSNPFFQVNEIKPAMISPSAQIASPSLPLVFEYDLATERGKTYTFSFEN